MSTIRRADVSFQKVVFQRLILVAFDRISFVTMLLRSDQLKKVPIISGAMSSTFKEYDVGESLGAH